MFLADRFILVSLILVSSSACSGGSDGSASSNALVNSGGEVVSIDTTNVKLLSDSRFMQGGGTTVNNRSTTAFESPSANLSSGSSELHTKGDSNFASIFVTSPAPVNPGLGPLFNNNSCEACHTKNGRGQLAIGSSGAGSQALVRVSIADGAPIVPGGSVPFGSLGTQIQDKAIFGQSPDADIELGFEKFGGSYASGEKYTLSKPIAEINLEDGSRLQKDVMTSLRTAPPIFGIGLLEAVSESEVLSQADPNDANGDGISGKPNYVWSALSKSRSLGRFGRKANSPSVREQTAAAYFDDMGIANTIFNHGDGEIELSDEILNSAVFYSQTLAVPLAGARTSQVEKGELLFQAINCSGCHTPQLKTADHPVREVSNQLIFPYTDMLLHDMGPGLADNRPDFEASGTEWKTPPLWGIGVTATILSNTANFLHDGRAATLEEAILWHGGEAEASKEMFRKMPPDQRQELIEFLKSL